MTGDEVPRIPPVRPAETAPPLRPSPDARSRWPKVIGIISIILGAIKGLNSLCGALGAVFGPLFLKFFGSLMAFRPAGPPGHPTTGPGGAGVFPGELFEAMRPIYAVQAPITVMALAAAIVLLVAGIKLVKRRRSGRTLHLVHAAVQAVQVAAGIVIAWVFVRPLVQPLMDKFMSFAEPGEMPFSMFRGLFRGQMVVSSVIGAVWGLAYPVFLVIWFMRPKIRNEVDRWAAAGQAAVQAR